MTCTKQHQNCSEAISCVQLRLHQMPVGGTPPPCRAPRGTQGVSLSACVGHLTDLSCESSSFSPTKIWVCLALDKHMNWFLEIKIAHHGRIFVWWLAQFLIRFISNLLNKKLSSLHTVYRCLSVFLAYQKLWQTAGVVGLQPQVVGTFAALGASFALMQRSVVDKMGSWCRCSLAKHISMQKPSLRKVWCFFLR